MHEQQAVGLFNNKVQVLLEILAKDPDAPEEFMVANAFSREVGGGKNYYRFRLSKPLWIFSPKYHVSYHDPYDYVYMSTIVRYLGTDSFFTFDTLPIDPQTFCDAIKDEFKRVRDIKIKRHNDKLEALKKAVND